MKSSNLTLKAQQVRGLYLRFDYSLNLHFNTEVESLQATQLTVDRRRHPFAPMWFLVMLIFLIPNCELQNLLSTDHSTTAESALIIVWLHLSGSGNNHEVYYTNTKITSFFRGDSIDAVLTDLMKNVDLSQKFIFHKLYLSLIRY